jgi:hypothetical protein
MFRERTFLLYELYIATIALVAAAILFGILAALLAIVNTAYNPIEAICHIPGSIFNSKRYDNSLLLSEL